jgi:PleD family two-component response regulator
MSTSAEAETVPEEPITDDKPKSTEEPVGDPVGESAGEPAADELLTRKKKAPVPIGADNLTDANILIAIEDKPVQSLVRLVCKSAGFENILEATDMNDALAILHEKQVDIVICGPLNKDMSTGLNLVHNIRRQKKKCKFREVPLLMVSGSSVEAQILDARDAGVTEFMVLPVSAQIVESRIRTTILSPRGFVESDIYTGPDRRRRNVKIKGGEKRASNEPEPENSES